MRKVLILCPTKREFRDLPDIAKELDCELLFEDIGSDYFDQFLGKNPKVNGTELDILAVLNKIINRYRNLPLDGVTSGIGYPGMSAASIIAKELNLPGPNPESVMVFEHKYYSRLVQQKHVPYATPAFSLVNPREPDAASMLSSFPVFLKPVKSCMSINAYSIHERQALERCIRSSLLPEGFVKPFDDMVRAYTNLSLNASYLLAESLLKGHQVSLEGYVFDGEVHVMGILDSLMFPETISFRRFQYPSQLDMTVQERMVHIADTLMSGVGYNNAPFNIELIYDPDTDDIHIIEVNPKLASQFPDLFQKVDGISSYAVLLQLALGERPKFTRRHGKFKMAASCVLRMFEDKHVLGIPSQEQINEITRKFPDALIEVHASTGKNLSSQMQDAKSFRYGLINIGADSEGELDDKFEHIRSALQFEFAPVELAVT